MFGSYMKPVNAYQSVGITSSVETADPHQLILLLFEGAVAAIALAKVAMEQGRVADKGNAISKAIDIIDNGLKASLDMDKGGDLAERLDALYDYMVQRLLTANLKNDLGALEEVGRLLAEIQSAWTEIRPKVLETGAASHA